MLLITNIYPLPSLSGEIRWPTLNTPSCLTVDCWLSPAPPLFQVEIEPLQDGSAKINFLLKTGGEVQHTPPYSSYLRLSSSSTFSCTYLSLSPSSNNIHQLYTQCSDCDNNRGAILVPRPSHSSPHNTYHTHPLCSITTFSQTHLYRGDNNRGAISVPRPSHSSLITLTTLFVLSSPSNLLITYINVLVVTITGEQFRYRASWQRYNDQYWLTCVYLLGRWITPVVYIYHQPLLTTGTGRDTTTSTGSPASTY